MLSRTIVNQTAAPYVFHAYDVSYFSAKVRPAIRYKKLRRSSARRAGAPARTHPTRPATSSAISRPMRAA